MANLTLNQIDEINADYTNTKLNLIIDALAKDELLEITVEQLPSLYNDAAKYLLFKLATNSNPKVKIGQAKNSLEIFAYFYNIPSFRHNLNSITNIEQIISNRLIELSEEDLKKLFDEIKHLNEKRFFFESYILIALLAKYKTNFLAIADQKLNKLALQDNYAPPTHCNYGEQYSLHHMFFLLLENEELIEYIIKLPQSWGSEELAAKAQEPMIIDYLHCDCAAYRHRKRQEFLSKLIDSNYTFYSWDKLKYDTHNYYLTFSQLEKICSQITDIGAIGKLFQYISALKFTTEQSIALYNLLKSKIAANQIFLPSLAIPATHLMVMFDNLHNSIGSQWHDYFSAPPSLPYILGSLMKENYVPTKAQIVSLLKFTFKNSIYVSWTCDDKFLNFFKLEPKDVHDILLEAELAKTNCNPTGYFINFMSTNSNHEETRQNRRETINFIKKIFTTNEMIEIFTARFCHAEEEPFDDTIDNIDEVFPTCILDQYINNSEALKQAPNLIKFLCSMFALIEPKYKYTFYGSFALMPKVKEILHHIRHFNKICIDSGNLHNPLNYLKDILDSSFTEPHALVQAFCSAISFETIDLTDDNQAKKLINLIKWLVLAAVRGTNSLILEELIKQNQELHTKILIELANLPDNLMRLQLTIDYFSMCSNAHMLTYFHQLMENQNPKASTLIILLAKIFHAQKAVEQSKIINEIVPKVHATFKHGKSHKIMLQALLAFSQNNTVIFEDLFEILNLILTPLPIYVDKANNLDEAKAKITQYVHKDPYACVIVTYNEFTSPNAAISYIHNYKRITNLSNKEAKEEHKKPYEQLISYGNLSKGSMIKKSDTVVRSSFLAPQLKRQDSLWMMLYGLSKVNKVSDLYTKASSKSLDEAAADTYLEIFGIEKTDASLEYLENNILSKRDATALLIYNATLLDYVKENPEDASHYLNAMQQFIRQIITFNAQDFYAHRYHLSSNNHLQAIASLGYDLKLWQDNYGTKLIAFQQAIDFKLSDFNTIDYQTFFYNKIILHKHLHDNKPFDELQQFLTGDKIIRDTIDDKIKALMAEPDFKVHQYYREYNLIAILIRLCIDSNLSLEIQQELIDKALDFALASHFKDDLSRLLNRLNMRVDFDFEKSKAKTADWKIEFTDDYWKLLMMGTDVDGSCQKLYSSTFNLNKCLLVYLMCGHIKLVTIVNAQDKIVMRAAMRLCIDQNNQKPVIHFEDIYAANGTPEYLEMVLLKYAQQLCSKHLKCDLVVSSSNNLVIDVEPYPSPIDVLDIPTKTTEYVDALHGAQYAPYSINNTLWLFNKSKQQSEAEKEDLSSKTSLRNRV